MAKLALEDRRLITVGNDRLRVHQKRISALMHFSEPKKEKGLPAKCR
jgi:hypothetical protein